MSAALQAALERGSFFCKRVMGLAGRGPACVGFSLEHPEDPGCEPFASVWATSEMQQLLASRSAASVGLDLCRFGAPSRKPTRVAGVLPDLESLGLRCCHRSHPVRLEGRSAIGGFATAAAQAYPPAFNAALAARHLAHAALARHG